MKVFEKWQVYKDWINNYEYVVIWVTNTHITAVRLDTYVEFVARKRFFEPDTYIREFTAVERVLFL
jgi:hypothetical protein